MVVLCSGTGAAEGGLSVARMSSADSSDADGGREWGGWGRFIFMCWSQVLAQATRWPGEGRVIIRGGAVESGERDCFFSFRFATSRITIFLSEDLLFLAGRRLWVRANEKLIHGDDGWDVRGWRFLVLPSQD